LQGVVEQAIVYLRERLNDPRSIPRNRCYGLAKLGDALTRQLDSAAALAVAKGGLNLAAETGHHQWLAELHRLEGGALCSLNMLEDSQKAFEDALRVARRQGAKAYELRAAMTLDNAENSRCASKGALRPAGQTTALKSLLVVGPPGPTTWNFSR
jgi:hypothetical protein